jgi:hypothetical protein
MSNLAAGNREGAGAKRATCITGNCIHDICFCELTRSIERTLQVILSLTDRNACQIQQHSRVHEPEQAVPQVIVAVAFTISASANSPEANSGPAGLFWLPLRQRATSSAPPNVLFILFSFRFFLNYKWTFSFYAITDMTSFY